ncbi:SHC-transforming protein 4 [Gracilinanus agilis]|uniref:SHC-transforming protein 4 n=1 Tax=Gracilinanus agilis TaxID=191870 RepID=UPI001CFDC919|nr:SHC-transforming protein 4 [Gracilinanus agilis]
MRGRSPENLSGHVLYVGLFGHPGMLHRAKYSRFRNEPITSLDEGSSGGSVNVKGVPPTSPSSPLPVHLPGEDVTLAAQDNPTPLCTLMPRMASLRLANPANLLGLKNFCLGTREVPKLKLLENRGAAPSSPTSPETSLSRATSAASPQPDGETLESCILPTSEAPPSLGSQDGSSRQHLLGTGMNYCVRYVGCVEVLQSMRSLDFGMRTQVTREAISRLCEAVPGENGPIKRRKPPVKFLSSVLGRSNLQFSGINIKLTVSTCSLTLMNIDTQQIIANHHMQSISFASGGDPDTTDYVAYVAKDPVNQRACHILECPSGMAQDVINTIGQAFELRFKEYLKNPSSLNLPSEREEVNIDDSTEEKEEHEYYNEIPGKQPPAGGVLDARMKVQTTEQRTYCPIQCEKLCCSPRNPKCSSVYENCLEPSKAIGSISERIVKTQRDPPLTKHRCRVDLFDDPCYINTQPFQTAIWPGNQDPAQGLGSPLHGATELPAGSGARFQTAPQSQPRVILQPSLGEVPRWDPKSRPQVNSAPPILGPSAQRLQETAAPQVSTSLQLRRLLRQRSCLSIQVRVSLLGFSLGTAVADGKGREYAFRGTFVLGNHRVTELRCLAPSAQTRPVPLDFSPSRRSDHGVAGCLDSGIGKARVFATRSDARPTSLPSNPPPLPPTPGAVCALGYALDPLGPRASLRVPGPLCTKQQ